MHRGELLHELRDGGCTCLHAPCREGVVIEADAGQISVESRLQTHSRAGRAGAR